MATVVDELLVKISADLSELQNELKKGEGEVSASSSKMSKAFESIGRGIRASAQQMVNFTKVVAGASVALAAFTRFSIQSQSDLVLMAQALGVSTQSFTELAFATGQFNVEAEELGDSIKDVQERIADAALNGGSFAETINNIGLNIKDLQNLNAEEQFLAVGNALARMEDQGRRNFLAMELGSDALLKLNNFFDQGEDAIEGMRQEARLFGAAISDIDGQRVLVAQQAFVRLESSLAGIGNVIAQEVAPLLAFMGEQLLGMAKNTKGAHDATAAFGIDAVTVFETISAVWSGVVVGFQVGATIISGVSAAFWTIASTAETVARTVSNSWDAFVDFLGTAWDAHWLQAETTFTGFANSIIGTFGEIQRSIGNSLRELGSQAIGSGIISEDVASGLIDAGLSMTIAGGRLVRETENFAKEQDEALNQAALQLKESTDRLAASFDIEKAIAETNSQGTGDIAQEAVKMLQNNVASLYDSIDTLSGGTSLAERIFGSSEDFQNYMANLEVAAAATLAKQQETQEAQLNNQLTFDEMVLQARAQYQDSIARQDADNAARNQALWAQGLRGQLQVTGQIFGQLEGLMNSHSRKAFEVGKAAAIANATINTYQAAVGAYNAMVGIPIVGPGLAVAAAAAAVAAGVANIQQINSTQFGSRGTPSAAGAAPSSQPSSQQAAGLGTAAPATNVAITLVGDGNDRFSGNTVRSLISEIDEQVGDGVRLSTN